MYVKKLFLLLTVLTSTFAFTSFVQADGDHSSNISDAVTNFQGKKQQPSSSEDPHSEMNHGDDHGDPASSEHNSEHSAVVQSEHQQSEHSDSGHSENGHSNQSVIQESPPNYKVLGTFGLINMGFLSLGVILKIRKRKEAPYAVK